MHRSVPLLVLAIIALVASAATALASPSTGSTGSDGADVAGERSEETFTYTIESRGDVQTDADRFAATAGEILDDARGWTLAGSVEFVRVGSDADFRLVLASPEEVDRAHEVCSPDYSCRVGDQVLINDDNWRNATSAWRDADAPLWMYREYLINHEVGHFLGFDHHDCPGSGEPAPVMQQQSISLDGCEPNGWPLEWERETLGERLGVPVYDWVFRDVLEWHTHRDNIHRVAHAEIAFGDEQGYYRPGDEVSRGQMASFLARALDLDNDDPPRFDDVDPDHAHADAIAAVDEAGIAEGHEDGTFRPAEPVNRAQMASFVAAAFDLDNDDPPRFDDVDPDDEHAGVLGVRVDVVLDEAGVAQGYDDRTYRPGEYVTRGQMATFIARAHPDL